MYGTMPYIPREERIEASQSDSLTIMVSPNRQNLLDDIARAEQQLAELAAERDRLLRHLSQLRKQLDAESAVANQPDPANPSSVPCPGVPTTAQAWTSSVDGRTSTRSSGDAPTTGGHSIERKLSYAKA